MNEMRGTMKAVSLEGNRKVEVPEFETPAPKDDLVVVKILSSALCGTEHTAYFGQNGAPIPGASGHEGAGVVWQTDRTEKLAEGDRVTIFPTVLENCRRCAACRAGEWLHCHHPVPRRSVMGTHAEYMLVPEYLCLPLPESISFDEGAMIGDCIGTPYRAIKRLGVGAADRVLVTGAGPIGAAATVIARYRQAEVIVVDVNDYRLERARACGADVILNPARDDVPGAVRELTGRGVDFAVECSGQAEAQTTCLDAARPGGGVAFLGIKNATVAVDMSRHFVLKELTLIGSWASTATEHDEVVRAIEAGMPVGQLITHRFAIDDAPAAFERFFDGKAVKVALHPWGETAS